MRRVDVLVVGAGPGGLGAATRLQERGADWLVVETTDRPGGMAAPDTDAAGFRWHPAGPLVSGRSADLDRAVAATGVPMHPPGRSDRVWTGGALRPAPSAGLGPPFAEKLWAAPPGQLDPAASGVRPEPPGAVPAGPLWAAIAARLDPASLWLRSRVCAVDLQRRTAHLADGRAIGFVDCVSTMPLTTLLRSVGRPEWAARGQALSANATLVVGLGYADAPPAELADTARLYCPDPDIAWHRATPADQGSGRWSAQCEVGHSAFRPVDRAGAVASCRATLAELGADPATLVSTWVRDVPRGHPVPTPGRDALLREIDAGLVRRGVRSRGRLGGWRYESDHQDVAFQQGVEAVEAIMAGSPEEAYWRS